jgi:hypothetical protein
MIANENAVLDVLVDLPTVCRVDLLDVDGEKINALAIGAVDAIEGPSLGPKRRSGIAPEDQGDGSLRKSAGEPDPLAFGCALPRQVGQLEIGRPMTDTGLRVGPQ